MEIDLWSGTYSSKAMIGSWIMALVVSVAALITILMIRELRTSPMVWVFGSGAVVLLWVALAFTAAYQKLGHRYELTNVRLKHRDGILFRTQNRLELIDVDDVLFRQGPIQSMLRVGDIVIESSDKSHPQLVLRGIANVANVVDMIDDARRKERRRHGLHVNN